MIVSADSHIDMHWLPPTLFLDHAPAGFKDRMPRVVDSPEGPKWVTPAGSSFGYAGGVGATGRLYRPGMSYRADKMAEAGLYADAQGGILRPTDPSRRIADQDLDGIDAEVLYGMLLATIWMRDEEAARHLAHIYNEWLADFCDHYPDRLIGLAVIAGPDPAHAAEEVAEVARRGSLRGIDISGLSLDHPLYDASWSRFWSVAEDARLPVHFHGTGPKVRSFPDASSLNLSRAKAIGLANAGMEQSNGVLREMILGGVLQAHPRMRFILAESGIGWIPYILERMDHAWEDQYRAQLDLTKRPSEYWFGQCYATYQDDEFGSQNLDAVGVDNVMWASDFPHPDGLWPESLMFIDSQFDKTNPTTKQKVIGGNAQRLYGLNARPDSPSTLAHTLS